MIEVKDLITLDDDKEYCVAFKNLFEGNTYYFLVDINDSNNIKVCREKIENSSIKLTQIEDSNLLDKLMVSFATNLKNN